jgi:hypothetical protein
MFGILEVSLPSDRPATFEGVGRVCRPIHGANGGPVRFNRRAHADRVAAAINRALEAEGRLLVYSETV